MILLTTEKERILDAYPEPLNYLLVELVQGNEAYWLEDDRRQKLRGAEVVREQGLTTNQQRWATTIAENLEKSGEQNA